MASEGCPPAFIQLALDCVEEDPRDRPEMRQVVSRLRDIEREVLLREEAENRYAIGSVRGATIQSIMGTKLKRAAPPRLPSFNGALKLGSRSIPARTTAATRSRGARRARKDRRRPRRCQVARHHQGLQPEHAQGLGPRQPMVERRCHRGLPSINRSWLASPGAAAERIRQESEAALLDNADYAESDYSTSVVRSSKMSQRHAPLAMLDERASTLSVRTLRQSDSPLLIPARRGSADASAMQSFMTARTHRPDPSMALATIASVSSGVIEPVPICHRFTLVKNGTRRPASVAAARAAGGVGLEPPAR